MAQTPIPGYTYGTVAVARSPLSLDDLELLKKTLLFTEDDTRALRQSYDVLKDQVDAVLDVWYGFVASNPHLVHFFTRTGDGQPDAGYLDAVRKRFAQWVLDTAQANYNQDWLNYQFEIGRRHHRTAKNQTDRVHAVAHIPFRYLPTLIYPITATLKPFMSKKGHSAEEVERMHQAWIKSVLLQITLWSQPYVKEGDF